MIKAAKKLKKYWPGKKRRKKTNNQEPRYYHLPPPCHYCCSHSTPVQPSAPPLPPWLEEPEQTHETIYAPGLHQHPEVVYQTQVELPSQEIVVESNPICPTLPVEAPFSYQQYTVPNPVYGATAVETPKRERSAGFFGCVVSFGVNLIRCFCPCFRIREVD